MTINKCIENQSGFIKLARFSLFCCGHKVQSKYLIFFSVYSKGVDSVVE